MRHALLVTTFLLATAGLSAQNPFVQQWHFDRHGLPSGLEVYTTNPCIQTIHVIDTYIEYWDHEGRKNRFPIDARVDAGPQRAEATWNGMPFIYCEPQLLMIVKIEYYNICTDTWDEMEFARPFDY